MIKTAAFFAALLAFAFALAAGPGAAAAPPLRLERVVILMRHGVRPPTRAEPIAPGLAADPWPSWPVPWGWLTPHGRRGVRLQGAYDRAAFAARGLWPARGCLPKDAVDAWADTDERTIASADAYLDGLDPGCGHASRHYPQDTHDPLFSPAASNAVEFDRSAAAAAIQARAGPDGIAGVAAAQARPIATLGRILGCCAPTACAQAKAAARCTFSALPTTFAPGPDGVFHLSGPLEAGSTAAEVFLLEYAEGKPMGEVGWGRASAADIAEALKVRSAAFDLLVRTPYVAARNAGPIALDMVDALSRPAKLFLILGHDTNVSGVGGLLDLHWHAPGYAADDVPPGGAIAFELLRSPGDVRYVRAVFHAQGLEQLRALTPLTAAHPPHIEVLPIPGCAEPCPLPAFRALVTSRAVARNPAP